MLECTLLISFATISTCWIRYARRKIRAGIPNCTTTLTRAFCLIFHLPTPLFEAHSQKSASRRRCQERSSASSRARTESSIARQHSRWCACREDSAEYGSSCSITCDSKSRTSAQANTVGDGARPNGNQHGDKGEQGGCVEEARCCSGCTYQQRVGL